MELTCQIRFSPRITLLHMKEVLPWTDSKDPLAEPHAKRARKSALGKQERLREDVIRTVECIMDIYPHAQLKQDARDMNLSDKGKKKKVAERIARCLICETC